MKIRSNGKRDEKRREKKWEKGRRSKYKRDSGRREKTKKRGKAKRKKERN